MLISRTLRGDDTVSLSPGFVQMLQSVEAAETSLTRIAAYVSNIKEKGATVPAILLARYNEIYDSIIPLTVGIANDRNAAVGAADRGELSLPPRFSITSTSGLQGWMVPSQAIEFVFYNQRSKMDFEQKLRAQFSGLGVLPVWAGTAIIATIAGLTIVATTAFVMYGLSSKYRTQEAAYKAQADIAKENSARLRSTAETMISVVDACGKTAKDTKEFDACVSAGSKNIESAIQGTPQDKFKPVGGIGFWGYVGIAAAAGVAAILISNYVSKRRVLVERAEAV